MRLLDQFKNKLVEIYIYDNYEKMDVGYILSEDDKDIFVQLISPMGFLDGKFMISKDSINKVQSDTKYLKEIEILIKQNTRENVLNGYIFNNTQFDINDEKSIFELVIEQAIKTQVICTIISISNEEKTFGYIKGEDEKYIFVEYKDQKITMRKDEISSISVDTITQRRDVLVDL